MAGRAGLSDEKNIHPARHIRESSRYWASVGPMLRQRPGRWRNIGPTLSQWSLNSATSQPADDRRY